MRAMKLHREWPAWERAAKATSASSSCHNKTNQPVFQIFNLRTKIVRVAFWRRPPPYIQTSPDDPVGARGGGSQNIQKIRNHRKGRTIGYPKVQEDARKFSLPRENRHRMYFTHSRCYNKNQPAGVQKKKRRCSRYSICEQKLFASPFGEGRPLTEVPA